MTVIKVMVEMKQFEISQVPVFENGKSVGSISDHNIFQKILDDPMIKEFPVKQIMEEPFQKWMEIFLSMIYLSYSTMKIEQSL